MKKPLIALIVIVAGLGFYFLSQNSEPVENTPTQTTNFQPDASSATFTIEGETITLSHGIRGSEEGEISILGEKATGDLNNDGKTDTALLLADTSVGSGVFIYIAAYVSGPVSYKGTGAIFIGDRISPESISINNGVVTLEYLDRKPDEPFSSEPTVSVTKQFVFKNGEFVAK